jgi:hypothetical protein
MDFATAAAFACMSAPACKSTQVAEAAPRLKDSNP